MPVLPIRSWPLVNAVACNTLPLVVVTTPLAVSPDKVNPTNVGDAPEWIFWGSDTVMVPAPFAIFTWFVVPVRVPATAPDPVEPISSCPLIKAVDCRTEPLDVVTTPLAVNPDSVNATKVGEAPLCTFWGRDKVMLPAAFAMLTWFVVPVSVAATAPTPVEPIRSCPFVNAVDCSAEVPLVVTTPFAVSPERNSRVNVGEEDASTFWGKARVKEPGPVVTMT